MKDYFYNKNYLAIYLHNLKFKITYENNKIITKSRI